MNMKSNAIKIHVARQLTKEELTAIDDLAARFAEGSDDLMSLSYQIQRAVNAKLLNIEMRREREVKEQTNG